MRHFICALLLLGTSACVAAWGGAYNVALENSRSIVIEYDPAIINIPQILSVAQTHCDKFKRDALLSNTSKGNIGIIVNTYECVSRNI